MENWNCTLKEHSEEESNYTKEIFKDNEVKVNFDISSHNYEDQVLKVLDNNMRYLPEV